MNALELVRQYGLPLIFASILGAQAGVPLPAATMLVLAGAFSHELPVGLVGIIVGGAIASLVSDHAWYALGRTKGMSLMVRLEGASPRALAALRMARMLNRRYGAGLLLIAKFLPGIHALVIPTSAALKLSYKNFILFDAVGALVWVSFYALLGSLLGPQVRKLVGWVSQMAGWSAVIVAGLVGIVIVAKAVSSLRRPKHAEEAPEAVHQAA